MPPKLKLLAGSLISFLLTGCTTNGAGIVDSACSSFGPISMSKSDTDPTKRQIIGHNKAYDAICPGQGGTTQKVASR